MKGLIVSLFAVVIGLSAHAQDQYQVIIEKSGEKILKGILSRDVIEKDTSYKWFADNQKNYAPNAKGLEAMKKYKDSIQLLVFMGTWCEDSHFIIPKLFSLIDQSGFSNNRLTLIGVDRDKKTLSHLSEALDVTKAPTIIITKAGKEIGRVVEFGKYGLFDMEMGEYINAAFK